MKYIWIFFKYLEIVLYLWACVNVDEYLSLNEFWKLEYLSIYAGVERNSGALKYMKKLHNVTYG